MATIKSILIPTDFSETATLAVAHGANMAHLFNAKIFLLHSVETTIYTAGSGEPVLAPVAENLYKIATEQLTKQAKEIKKKYDVDISTLVVSGKPAASITTAIKENNIDIVIMGTHGASGVEEFLTGSNTQKVVSHSPCPVISIRLETKNIRFSNIILPIGNGLHSRQKVNNAIEIASKYNSTVHILGLLETDDSLDDKKFEIKLETVESLLEKDKIKFTTKVIRAHNPALEAIKFSEEVGGDLILIMADHESDLSGSFLGAGSKQIANHAKIPVMSIKPEETMVETFDPAGGSGTL